MKRALGKTAIHFFEIIFCAATGKYLSITEGHYFGGSECGWFEKALRIPLIDETAPADIVSFDKMVCEISNWLRQDIPRWLSQISDREQQLAASEIINFLEAARELSQFAPKSVTDKLALWFITALIGRPSVEKAAVLGWLHMRKITGHPENIAKLTAYFRAATSQLSNRAIHG